MLQKSLHIPFRTLIAIIFFWAATPAMADDSPRHMIADGIDVYLGVAPAELFPQEPSIFAYPRKRHQYNVLIALFERASGKRIIDAEVETEVGALGMNRTKKELLPIHEEKMRSYSNVFWLPDPGEYRIKVHITLPHATRALETEFIFERPRD